MKAIAIVACLVLMGCGGNDHGNWDSGAVDAIGDTADAAFPTAPHRAWPQIPAGDGVRLSAMRLVWITSPDDDAGRAYYGPMFGALGAPGNMWWVSVAGEYAIQPPRAVIAVQGPTPLTGTTPFSLSDLKAYVDATVAAQPSLAPDGTTLFVVVLPKGVGTGSPCSAGGSHTRYGSLGDHWAHITRCAATTGTYTTTHEIIEAATDPSGAGLRLSFDRSTAWAYSVFAATDGEVGDLCEAMGSFVDAGVKYQRSWSNQAAAAGGPPCVPAATTPFFDVSAAQDWYPISPGGSIDVPLIGFSTAPMADWKVTPSITSRPGPGSGTGYTAAIATSSINNGGSATLTVNAATSVSPGSWALVRVISDGTQAGVGESYVWPVGVYFAASH